MSEDDGFPSATSVTESDPVSDVDPKEMARLLDEIGNDDDDIISKKSQDPKKSHSANELGTKDRPPSPKDTEVKTKSACDDWDEDDDDLLKSDSDQQTPVIKKEKAFMTEHAKSFDQAKQGNETIGEINLQTNRSKASQQEDKQLPSKSDNLTGTFESPIKTERKLSNPLIKKVKEISFDEDDNPLDMNNITSKAKKTNMGVEPDFMDSLLGKTSDSKYENKTSKEFTLPDKYKSAAHESNILRDELRGYQPSTSDSPTKRNPSRVKFSDSLEGLITSDSPRTRRRATPSRENKSFEISDDEILTSLKRKNGKENDAFRNVTKPVNSRTMDQESKNTKHEDWLFSGGSRKSPEKKTESISPTKESAPRKSDDWLNELLTSDKTSPRKNNLTTQNPKNPGTLAADKNNLGSNSAFPLTTGTLGAQPQQQQVENQIQILQLQLQDQHIRMAQMLSQQNQLTISSLPTLNSNQTFTVEDDESIKKIKIDLHKASTEVGSLEAELELLRKQHSQEIGLMETANRKQIELEKEVWSRTEERMKEEREKLIENHNRKICELQSEKEVLISTNEANMAAIKAEWVENLSRTKELYSSVIDRMKREHQNAVERLTELKNVELQALISATGKAKEAEMVFDQLEENTANLSKLALCVQERNDSAFHMSKKALELKEKQLKEMESQLSVARAEAESERNRLTVLVNRLESNLANQGTEVESDKWKLSQEKTKLEMERNALMEERKQFSIMMNKERLELTKAKQNLWNEQREVMQNIMKQKSEIASALSHMCNNTSTNYESEFNLSRLNEEKNILEEKIVALKMKKEELLEEEFRNEEKNSRLKEEHDRLNVVKEFFDRDKERGEEKLRDIERAQTELEEIKNENEKKLNDLIRATDNLHHLEDKIAKERSKLKQQEYDAMYFIKRGFCPSCKSSGTLASRNVSYSRMPGDDIESIKISGSASYGNNRNFDPASVMERLQAARQEESVLREEKLQKISALSHHS